MSGSTQAIILHLNTRDYALPGKFLVPFLTGRLATRDIVAIYNRSSGIRFPMPTMEQKAKDLLGLDKPTPTRKPSLCRARRCHRDPAVSGAPPPSTGPKLPPAPWPCSKSSCSPTPA